jgi:hypothetical protein
VSGPEPIAVQASGTQYGASVPDYRRFRCLHFVGCMSALGCEFKRSRQHFLILPDREMSDGRGCTSLKTACSFDAHRSADDHRMIGARCPLLALSGHAAYADECPLLEEGRTLSVEKRSIADNRIYWKHVNSVSAVVQRRVTPPRS